MYDVLSPRCCQRDFGAAIDRSVRVLRDRTGKMYRFGGAFDKFWGIAPTGFDSEAATLEGGARFSHFFSTKRRASPTRF